MFSFNYKLIFVLSLAFNLTNLKSRGYPDEELSEQEKSRTTQEQGNSKLNFRKLHCTGVVLPPITKRPAGRPPTKRIKLSLIISESQNHRHLRMKHPPGHHKDLF
ncbi:ankyrin repeat family protein, partial [Prunus dulcis]